MIITEIISSVPELMHRHVAKDVGVVENEGTGLERHVGINERP